MSKIVPAYMKWYGKNSVRIAAKRMKLRELKSAWKWFMYANRLREAKVKFPRSPPSDKKIEMALKLATKAEADALGLQPTVSGGYVPLN